MKDKIEINKSNIYLLNEDTRFFLLVVPTSDFYEIDKMTYDYLNLLKEDFYTHEKVFTELSKNYPKNELKEIKSEMKEIFLKPFVKKKNMINYPIRTVCFNVTQQCNLRCIYCYGGDGGYGNPKQMSREVARQAVKFFMSKLKEKQTLNINFFGGEPLLNFDLIKDIVNLSEKISKEKNINMIYNMTSNGTLLSDEIIDYLEEKKIGIMISMDGGKTIQDRNRPLVGNNSSYEKMINGIKKLIKRRKKVTVRATITKRTQVKEVIKQLKEIGFSNIYCTPVSSDNDKISLSADDNREIIKELNSITLDLIKNGSKSQYFSFGGFKRNLEEIYRAVVKEYPCGAGRGYVGLDVDGNIYLCHRFVGQEEFIIGNIYEGFNKKRMLYLQDTVTNKNICSKCWARYLCGGGCYHQNFIDTNDTMTPDSQVCEFIKKIILNSLKQYIHLSNTSQVSLNNRKENINY